MHLTQSIDPGLFNVTLPVHARFQIGWVTCVAMKRRLRPVPVPTSSAGSTGCATGPRPSPRPREGRPAPSPQGGVENPIRPQRRNSGGPQAQAAGPRRALHRTPRGRGDIVEEGRSYPHGPRPSQGVEGNGGQGRVRGIREMSYSPPRPRFDLGSATRVRSSPPLPQPRQWRFQRWGFLHRRRRRRQRIHGKGLLWLGRACQRRAGALRPRERAVPRDAGGEGAETAEAAEAAEAAAAYALRFAGSVPSQVRLPRTTLIRFAQ